jgi:hypothetical protein
MLNIKSLVVMQLFKKREQSSGGRWRRDAEEEIHIRFQYCKRKA